MADTRKDKRAPVSLKVRFKSATVDEFIEHYCKDVSRGGIFIKSSQPMPVGTLLKFQFQLKDESALIRGVGRVVWTRIEEDAAADKPPGMGIKFIKMDNDSRALVERIVEAHEPEEGTYERGREQATEIAPISSQPPAPEAGSFFPNLPPAELPPPEDRTAVRQATQSLAAVLGGGSDESAAEEARQRAEEARRRSEEIEAQRRREAEQQAEQRKRREVERGEAERSDGSLPSMIIDPTLEPRAGRAAEGGESSEVTPLRPSPLQDRMTGALREEDGQAREPDTEPPPASQDQPPTSTTSIPPLPDGPRRSYAPILAITAVLLIAAVVAVRGGPRELPVEPVGHETQEDKPAEPPSATGASAPEPAAAAQAPSATGQSGRAQDADGEPGAGAPEARGPGASEPGTGERTAKAKGATSIRLEVAVSPRGAEVLVGDTPRGTAPLTLELPEGAPVTVRARAAGYAEASQELTPSKKSGPVRFKLKALPYIVHVDSTPAGASVNVGGHKGTAPVDLKLEAPPSGELSASARLSGYDAAHARLAPAAFSEREGAMRASLAFALKPEQPAVAGKEATPATPKERPKKAESRKAPKPAQGTPDSAWQEGPTQPLQQAPAPAPPEAKPTPPETKPEAPAPSPEAPQAPLPDNPFGGE